MRKIILIASLAILTLMAAVTGADASSTAVSSFSPSSYVVGSGVRVSIAVTPDANIASCTVEDTAPSGWTVSNISNGGIWMAKGGKVQWDFADNAARTLSYTATPPAGESGTRTFSGVAWFQIEHTYTHEQPITGARSIDKAPDVVISGCVRTSGDMALPGVTITPGSGTPVTTDADGNYRLTIDYGWSGTVASSSGSYRFFVLSDVTGGSTRSYTNITSNQSGQNYLGQAPWRGLAMVSIPIIPGSDNPWD